MLVRFDVKRINYGGAIIMEGSIEPTSEDDRVYTVPDKIEDMEPLPDLGLTVHWHNHAAPSSLIESWCPGEWMLWPKRDTEYARGNLCWHQAKQPSWVDKWTYGIGELENKISAFLAEPTEFTEWFAPQRFRPWDIYPKV